MTEGRDDQIVTGGGIRLRPARLLRGRGLHAARECAIGVMPVRLALEAQEPRLRERTKLSEVFRAIPFAPRATGNIATEDLVYLLHGMGYETGIDLDALIEVATWLAQQLDKELPGQVHKAGNFELGLS